MKGNLSDRQVKLLECIRDALMRRGYAPTIREMMTRTGIPSTSTVSYNLDRLEEAGYIRRQEGDARAVTLIADPRDLRAVLTLHADNLDLLAAEVYDMDADTLYRALTARAEGLRAALQTAGVSA